MSLHSRKLLLLSLLLMLGLLALDGFILSAMQAGNTLSFNGAGEGAAFPAFRTTDLRGRAVTEEILSGNFTAVCVWTTRGEGSREALGQICRLREGLPEKLQLLGLVGDLKEGDRETLARAREIAGELPADFPQLLVNDDFYPFLSQIHTVPTVCFVDAGGRLVGQPVTGAEPRLVEQEFCRILALDSPRSKALLYIHEALLGQP